MRETVYFAREDGGIGQDDEWENRAMYSRADAAVGCVRAAVPPRPAVAAYSGYRRDRRLPVSELATPAEAY